MTGLVEVLAMLCTAGGLVVAVLVFLRTGHGVLALRLALELWTAAGLLRLVGAPSFPKLLTAAGIVLLRQLLSYGLRHSAVRGLSARQLLRRGGRPPLRAQ